ncbi:MAG: iron-sulfur cluster assembly accessory protein [Plectolyngbya sp. WJT66-NPBG17]|nr:iron-sulfur cluster assembly accessory protein [Plectolyngbya sp. WJT66-NPBG17]MBW4528022.1 iron-sulfur cluster assembly accessory protein [Phormidium tanganyikae FI6-MK23]
MIELSQSAIAEIRRLRTRHPDPSAFFRLQIEPGGCAGLSYLAKFETELNSSDRIQQCHGIQIAIDPHSAQYLDNLTIDFSEDLMGGSFRFHNPNAKKSCDCGVSFSVNES